MLLVLILSMISRVESVVSPLDKVTQEIKEMKETVNSVQASLITSVSLIQDQLNDFTEKLSSKFEARLSSLDNQVSTINSNLASLTSRSHLWDSFHLHIEAWNSQLHSLDQKVEILRRSQEEKLNDYFSKVSPLPDMNIKIEKIGVQLKDVGGQLVVMDTRLLSLQDKVSTQESSLSSSSSAPASCDVTKSISDLENLIRSLNKSQRHSGRQLRQDHHTVDSIQNKVDQIYEHIVTNKHMQQDSPRFDYLRSEPQSASNGILTIEHRDEDEFEGEEFNTAEDKLLALFRRIATPFKRVNKRLMTMESLQDKIDTEISNIKLGIETTNEELMRRLSEFVITSNEISTEQTRLLESYATNFASLEQCCSSHAGDLDRFLVTSGGVLDRLDRWTSNWQNVASQKFDRLTQQNSYDHDTIVKGQKLLESLMVEGIEKCKFIGGGRGVRRTTTTTSAPVVHRTSTITTTSTTEDNFPIFHEYHQTDHEQDPDKSDQVTAVGCEHEDRSGIVSVGVTKLNGGGRDYHTRLCDQETSGGGWTVIQQRGIFDLTLETQINFTRAWEDYKHGFGDLTREFWYGNEFIHRLTNSSNMTLRVELEAHDGRTAWAEYSTFRVDGEDDLYRIWVGGYSGNASDSLSAHSGYKFSTVDNNNDLAPKCCPCAPAYGGGWWFYSCFESNLNGEYFTKPDNNGYYRGIIWELWLGDYSLKSTRMMIRPTGVGPLPPDP